MGRPYTEKENKADYLECKPHFEKLIEKGVPGCPLIAERLEIGYGRVLRFFSIFCREYSDKKANQY